MVANLDRFSQLQYIDWTENPMKLSEFILLVDALAKRRKFTFCPIYSDDSIDINCLPLWFRHSPSFVNLFCYSYAAELLNCTVRQWFGLDEDDTEYGELIKLTRTDHISVYCNEAIEQSACRRQSNPQGGSKCIHF